MGNCCLESNVKNAVQRRSSSSGIRRTSFIFENFSRQSDYKKKYELICIIGNGGFGKVRLYRDRKFPDMKYAIKTIKKDYASNHGMKYVIREVEILRNLDHPNIVNYFETYEDDLYCHIVMEYIPGQNLLQMISAKPYMDFGERDVFEIMLVLVKTIYFLHNNNVVHRDLKPENILFAISGEYETLKLIDFGLSIRNKEKDTYRVGSTYYMAPEMINGVFSHASDVWSIGVIMFFMVTGKQAFSGKNTGEVYMKISKGKFDISLLKKSTCSSELKDLIEKILVVDVKKRLSIQDILDHPWFKIFQEDPNANKLNEEIINSIREFNTKNIFQKEILFMIARISRESEILELKYAFKIIDKDNSGEIEYCEIPRIFEKLGISPKNGEIDSIWNAMDFHKDGKVNYTEFLAATLSAVKFSKEEKLWSVFKYFDSNDTGYITADNVINTIKSSNLPVNEKDLQDVFKSLKTGGNKINFTEFKQAFFSTSKENLVKE